MANILTAEDRILTTHMGSAPRPPALLDLMKAKAEGDYDPVAFEIRVTAAVETCVREQADAGIDIVADGEEKTGFLLYVQDRLAGLEPRPGKAFPRKAFQGLKRGAPLFLEDFEQYFQAAISKGIPIVDVPIVCAGPIEYVGEEQLHRDIDNLRTAASKIDCSAAFMSSIAPSGVGANEYYPSDEQFRYASGEALRAEYEAIVGAGFLLQIADPFLPALFSDSSLTSAGAERQASAYVDALNHSLRGIPADKIRYHVSCSRTARTVELPFVDVALHMLRVNAGAFSFDAAQARYEEDTELRRVVRLPTGKVIMPGLISHANDIVEDPESIADRLVRFADWVGRDNVVASVDSGATPRFACRTTVRPDAIWSKFGALCEGAERASERLWS
jgi:5-methyltetrahydropteroyltriglutamate--homocysteine methyltransferase